MRLDPVRVKALRLFYRCKAYPILVGSHVRVYSAYHEGTIPARVLEISHGMYRVRLLGGLERGTELWLPEDRVVRA